VGASGQIGAILRNFFYLYPFLSNSPTGQTVHHIFTLNGSNDADSRKGVQNPNFWGVNRHFAAKRVNFEMFIL